MIAVQRVRMGLAFGFRNRKLVVGLGILAIPFLIGIIGPLFVDVSKAQPISVTPNRPPSWEYPLGTESGGRDMLALLVVGTPQTLRLGLLAGGIGILIGCILGFTAAYYGGWIDSIIRGVSDTVLTIPTLAVLIVVAASVRVVSVEVMALIVASLAWMWPTRTIRSQVLTLKERAFVHMARLSGLSNRRIIIEELFPNLIPFIAASFVGAFSSAILAAVGLEVLGLGPQRTPTLGMTIYWAQLYSALIRGMWWWWFPPILILIILFVGLYITSTALDELANPRLRRTTS